MKILVTGKNGQVGSCFVKLLEQTELTFLALDREQLDITNAFQVNKLVSEFQPNIIVNAAAYTAVDKAEQEPELANAINRDGALNLALAANKVNAAIIHISTDYVFDGKGVESYTELAVTSPQSEYGRSKLAGEHAVAQACKKHIILRTAWVFGEHGNNFVKTMLRFAKTRNTLGVVADQFGGPTYAGDIASAILVIAKQVIHDSHTYGVYHFSGAPYVSWHAFSEKVFETALAQEVLTQAVQVNPIATIDYPTPAKRPASSRLNCDKIHNVFGIKQSDWQTALVKIKEYL